MDCSYRLAWLVLRGKPACAVSAAKSRREGAKNQRRLLDHLVRPPQHSLWNRETDLFRRLEIDNEFKLVGCSTGMSAGFVPFKILSTKTAERRYNSLIFGP